MPLISRIREALLTAEERDKTYGDPRIGFVNNGKVLHAAFPNGIELKTEEDFCRFVILVLCSVKYTRYTANFMRGGHDDSIHDLGVYALIMADFDEFIRERKGEKT